MKSQEIKIPEKAKVFVDKKTKVRTIAIPFILNSDHVNAVIMLSRIKDEDWNVNKVIKSITINYEN